MDGLQPVHQEPIFIFGFSGYGKRANGESKARKASLWG
jgi:hypothetical protein